VVGHGPMVAELAAMLRGTSYHGMCIVGACLAGLGRPPEVAGIPVYGGLDSIAEAVDSFGADTVAVLSCPEMNGSRLRELGWALEQTSTDMCVASALLDVAGPRTTIRPIAGLPLLHVDRVELGGAKRLVKGALDRLLAGLALLVLLPAFAVIARGVAASPGAAKGEIVLSAQEAIAAGAEGRECILVRTFTEADDVSGFHAARGILTSEGGKASHAALVARGMGRPAVTGAATGSPAR